MRPKALDAGVGARKFVQMMEGLKGGPYRLQSKRLLSSELLSNPSVNKKHCTRITVITDITSSGPSTVD